MRQMLHGLLCGAALLLPACQDPVDVDTGQEAPPEGCMPIPEARDDGWAVGAPGAHGLDEDALCALVDELRAGDIPMVDSLHVIRGGVLVVDEVFRTEITEYDFGLNTDLEVHTLQSATKSVVNALIGVGVRRGELGGVDDRLLAYFPEYGALENPDPRKDAWTIEDFLTMQSGLDWDEWGAPWGDPDNDLWTTYVSASDYTRALLDHPLVNDPGTGFTYCTICSYALGKLVQNAADVPLADYADAQLFDPLGITTDLWVLTPERIPNMGGGLLLSGRDMARFGQLYLQDGVWDGERLLPEGWVAETITEHVSFDGPLGSLGRGYGYHWWLEDLDDGGIYAAQGYGGQVIYVWPAQDAVIVFTGRNWDDYERHVPSEVMAGGLMAAFVE
ncbi:MAG: serine hydrolase [Alphaproteobacteria bacterium]|nr:serine hydrolase [Alphaproteobacteria bacterium]